MKVLYMGRYVDCPLISNCKEQCSGRCQRLELLEEKILEDAREVRAGMRENGYEDDN